MKIIKSYVENGKMMDWKWCIVDAALIFSYVSAHIH